ncbi:hypothetical protein MRX96_012913 [Rhipicephalus microplus]
MHYESQASTNYALHARVYFLLDTHVTSFPPCNRCIDSVRSQFYYMRCMQQPRRVQVSGELAFPRQSHLDGLGAREGCDLDRQITPHAPANRLAAPPSYARPGHYLFSRGADEL